MTKILIVDDHAIVRDGLRLIIGDVPDMEAAGEARNGNEVLEKVRRDCYDLVLLDISLPRMDGLEVLKILKREKPDLPVLILSMHPEEQYAVRAFKAGASGYLTKEGASKELIAAIRKVSGGEKYVTPSLAQKLALYLDTVSEKPLHEKLSDREYQVMLLLVSGKQTREIAEELALSIKTIGTYKTRILEKMRMKNTTELTLYAIKNGLVN